MPRSTAQEGSERHGAMTRLLRMRRRMTLDELAGAANLSKGHLSRFERGEKALSVAALIRVANALETSVSRLLGQVDDDVFRLVRAGGRMMHRASADDGGYEYAALSRASSENSTSIFFVSITGRLQRTASAHHAGEEAIFVLGGSIELELPNRSIVLSTGDYIQFPGYLRHVLTGLTPETQLLIMISGPDYRDAGLASSEPAPNS